MQVKRLTGYTKNPNPKMAFRCECECEWLPISSYGRWMDARKVTLCCFNSHTLHRTGLQHTQQRLWQNRLNSFIVTSQLGHLLVLQSRAVWWPSIHLARFVYCVSTFTTLLSELSEDLCNPRGLIKKKKKLRWKMFLWSEICCQQRGFDWLRFSLPPKELRP